ncbi:putative transporter permease [Megalodesulfovibrio gigas DSM 1382 = ATCC 19364]|uniref:Putative transporter permease n=1 Tax=Megalodesulfovibrio gigas (strain ATCC 19364 / DSM 1382 / NCIMB 9332 / VKM B-1759) TaxID=1121448 RepID=T2G7H3_MEGG1|nr:putative transporter permease [Megalodesulfovibrio gigas DSM 1382 = ATCC 19364]
MLALLLAVLALLAVSVAVGAASVPVSQVVRSLLGLEVPRQVEVIVWNIRLPQALACLIAGCGLALAGAAMQSILRNPLGSPFTLGISHAAAFGAALAVMFLGGGVMTSKGAVTVTNPWLTTAAAFACSLAAAGVIVGISRLRGASPEVMVLTGVALGALFTAGTMLLQYFADDVQLAAMVFWTFGDAARASWRDCAVMAGVTGAACLFFLAHSWQYNAIDAGDETARGLGVRVERVRMVGMLAASLATAVIISLLGVIGFVGLVAPHMVRRCIGADHRFLLPAAALAGGLLLLASDTAARLLFAPHVLPVSVLTAFLGAPAFLLLILGRRMR